MCSLMNMNNLQILYAQALDPGFLPLPDGRIT